MMMNTSQPDSKPHGGSMSSPLNVLRKLYATSVHTGEFNSDMYKLLDMLNKSNDDCSVIEMVALQCRYDRLLDRLYKEKQTDKQTDIQARWSLDTHSQRS
jgi:hypothetical protein